MTSQTDTTIVIQPTRRKGLAVLVGVLAAGLGVASAASLGGLQVQELGSSQNVTVSCDTDGQKVSWVPEWSSSIKAEAVSLVIVSDIAKECDGQQIRVTVTDLDGNSMKQVTDVASPTDMKFSFGDDIPAEKVGGVSVVIWGD